MVKPLVPERTSRFRQRSVGNFLYNITTRTSQRETSLLITVIVRIIYDGALQKGASGDRKISMTRSTILCSVFPSKIAFISCTHSMNSVYLKQWSENSRTECLWSMNTRFVVPLYKPSRKESRQNHCYGVQTPNKLTQIVLGSLFPLQCWPEIEAGHLPSAGCGNFWL